MKQDELELFKKSVDTASGLLKAMYHPDRLLILCYLQSGELSAGELNKFSSLSQSAFSQHLAILRKNGLVKIRRSSQIIYYSISNEETLKIITVLKEIFCKNI